MKIILLIVSVIVGIIALILLGFLFAFPATQIAKTNIIIKLSENGQALTKQAVVLWEYDYPSQKAVSNEQGTLEFENKGYSFSKIFLQFWKKRPEVFEVRLKMPEISNLYYRFEVKNSGSVEYEVFNDSYDYFFGEKWLGTFNDKTQVRKTVRDFDKTYSAVLPENDCKCVPLWKANAQITPLENQKYVIQLDLQRSGLWNASDK